MTRWTASMVEDRLEEAARTLRRLPPVQVCGYFSAWPQILHEANDKLVWAIEAVRLGPPDPAAISRMEETLAWFRWLTPEENRLIWMRASKTRWKSICVRFGCGRTTMWEKWVCALSKIAYMLSCEQEET